MTLEVGRMFGGTRLALDLAQTASTRRPARVRDNRPAARRARMVAELSKPGHAPGGSAEARAALRRIMDAR